MNAVQNRVKSNLWKIYSYRLLSNFWVIAPVLIPFYKSNGLNATKVFIVQSVYLAVLLIFEIPSGYLSDVIGRKKTLVLGAFLLPVGLGVYALSYGFYGFCLAELILAIAGSMRSGTDSALIYDTLIQLEQQSEYTKFEGKAEFFARIGDSTAAVLGGLFALITLRVPFYINIGVSLLLIPLSILLIEPEREKPSHENPFREVLKIVKYCLTHPKIRSVILFASILFSTGIIGVWSYYMYYEELGLSIGYYGILLAIFGLCSGLGSRQSHLLEDTFGGKVVLFLLLFISPVFLCIGLSKSIFLIPLIFLNGFLWGASYPLFTDYINQQVESDRRATVLSVKNMAGSLFFVILSPVFGRLVDSFSLSFAYYVLGGFFLVSGILSLFLLSKHKVI